MHTQSFPYTSYPLVHPPPTTAAFDTGKLLSLPAVSQERCLDPITRQRKNKEKIRLIGEMGEMSVQPFLGTDSALPPQVPGRAKVKAGALPWAPLVDGVDSLEV